MSAWEYWWIHLAQRCSQNTLAYVSDPRAVSTTRVLICGRTGALLVPTRLVHPERFDPDVCYSVVPLKNAAQSSLLVA